MVCICDAASFRFIEPNAFAETLLGEFVVSKAEILAEMTFSAALFVPRGFIGNSL
ncbi:hypothetical protein D019_2359 [Vibrio parahaemolyticus VP2007-095]|nr:hypothetical protein D019_2359 [Vibrio parahaemolyticus VP2007-095]